MNDDRVELPPSDVATSLRIWLAVLSQRRPAVFRDLWTRRGEEYDKEKIDHARHELARYLAEKMKGSGWQVTRRATLHDSLWEGEERLPPGTRE